MWLLARHSPPHTNLGWSLPSPVQWPTSVAAEGLEVVAADAPAPAEALHGTAFDQQHALISRAQSCTAQVATGWDVECASTHLGTAGVEEEGGDDGEEDGEESHLGLVD